MINPTDFTRREFVSTSGKAAAAIAAFGATAPSILRGATLEDDPVRVGFIGTGTRGIGVLQAAASNRGCKIVAVSDVYKPHLRNGVEMSGNPDCKSYLDYQELIQDPQVEAVFICSPDHWHEQMLLDAVAAGKDVYCEKGWTTSMEAAKRMREAVKKSGRVMQLGHQGRQFAAADIAHEMIAEGRLGDVTLVRCGRHINSAPERAPWRWYGGYQKYERPDPAEVIKDLDWERWLGPAPSIDFNERHFWHWRCYWAYGTGQSGDLLSHEMDNVQQVLRYGIPDSCSTQAHNAFWQDDREVPDTWLSAFVFEKQNCCVTYEGSMNTRRQQTPEYIGREGRMVFNAIGQNASQFEIFPDASAYRNARHQPLEAEHFFAPTREHRKPDHITDFLQCVRTREKPQCNEDEAFIETAVLMMSHVSFRLKRQVRWDAEKEEIV